jgi:hypothetical protein
MFIADRVGRVYVHNPGDPPSVNSLLLDISDHVNRGAANEDHGLLGIAADSDFAHFPYLYLLYTYEDGSASDGPKVSTLTRVTVTPDNHVGPETTLLGSVHTLKPASSPNGVCGDVSNTYDCIPSEGASHSIGTVRSAPDGTLWASTGDGNDFHIVDPLAFNDNDERTFRGKMMHITRDGLGLPAHPFCPTDNDLTHVCTKIFAGGLRQPFRFTLRPGGGLLEGDVGENTWEEINLVSGGEDFGWPCWEGVGHTNSPNYADTSQCAADYSAGGATPPAAAMQHVGYPATTPPCTGDEPARGNAVIGGPTYEGDNYPAGYKGQVFFGDYICKWVARGDVSGNSISYQQFASGWAGGVDLETAPVSGNLVYVDANLARVQEILYSAGNSAPAVAPTATSAAPLQASLNANASDADGDALSYVWDFGDGSPRSTAANPVHTYPTAGDWTAAVTVDDGRGLNASGSVAVHVTGAATSTAAGGSKPQVKVAGVSLAGSVARLAGRGILKGSFSSTKSIRALNVSLWRGRVGAGASASSCRFWSQRSGKLRRGSCGQPHWLRVTLHRKGSRYTWTLRLGARLPRGSYTVVVRALPRSAKLAPSAPKRLRLRVTR